jgi:hypothetical protein
MRVFGVKSGSDQSGDVVATGFRRRFVRDAKFGACRIPLPFAYGAASVFL